MIRALKSQPLAQRVAELFRPADYQFRVGARRGDVSAFFAPTEQHELLLAERRRWLGSMPARYARCTPRGLPVLQAFHALASAWPHTGAADVDCRALGTVLEPDFLLLARDSEGEFRLEAGALCFPTAWALEDKLGETVDWIHGPVPGLNAAIGPAISRVLAGLADHGPLERLNWGLAATPELNLHPALARPRPPADCTLETIWLRIEHQLLAPLPTPEGGGILFAIRMELVPLHEVLTSDEIRRDFARTLATMPADVAAYKGLAEARPRLLRLCAG